MGKPFIHDFLDASGICQGQGLHIEGAKWSNRHHIVITWVKPGTGLQSIARRFGYARDLCILTAVKRMCFSQSWQIADGWAFWTVEIAVV